MATTYYVQNAAAPYSPATFKGAWDDTTAFVSKALVQAPVVSDSFLGISGVENVATADYDVGLVRSVSVPLSTQTIAGTVNLVFQTAATWPDQLTNWHLHIYVTVGDSDSVRGTLLTDYRDASGSNYFPSGAAANIALQSTQSLTSVNVISGDRLVIEQGGCWRNTYSGFSPSATINIGAPAGGGFSDATVGGSTSNVRGHFDFSATILEGADPEPEPCVFLTTTRTDRGYFPDRVAIGTPEDGDPGDLAFPVDSCLALGLLAARTPGDPILSIDADGQVTAGPLEVGDIGPTWVAVSLGGSRAASLPLAAATYDLVNAEPAFTVPVMNVSTARIVADCRSLDATASVTPRLVNASTAVVAGTGSACTASAADYSGTNQHQTIAVTVVSGQTYKAEAIVAGAGAATYATFCTIRLEIG